MTEITTNIISKRMYAKCDKDRKDMLLIDSFIDNRKTERSLSLQDQQLVVNEKPHMKSLTTGSEICDLWKDEITTWEELLDLKEYYLVEFVEY